MIRGGFHGGSTFEAGYETGYLAGQKEEREAAQVLVEAITRALETLKAAMFAFRSTDSRRADIRNECALAQEALTAYEERTRGE